MEKEKAAIPIGQSAGKKFFIGRTIRACNLISGKGICSACTQIYQPANKLAYFSVIYNIGSLHEIFLGSARNLHLFRWAEE